ENTVIHTARDLRSPDKEPAEFKRAVQVATGQELSNNILDAVFKVFDLDGDECLSHEEFLGVLKTGCIEAYRYHNY
ncbi:hypothetical protein MC885_000120, partial [Smutsia gigantea]